jgi:hypothetical protein
MLHRSLDTKELSAVFDVCERMSQKTLAKGLQDPNPPVRHRAMGHLAVGMH